MKPAAAGIAFPDSGEHHGRGALVKTGERTCCMIGEWDDFSDIVAASERMIALLDTFRDTLEDLGGGLGVTDPVSGETVVELRP